MISYTLTIYVDSQPVAQGTYYASSMIDAEDRAPKIAWKWAKGKGIKDYDYGIEYN